MTFGMGRPISVLALGAALCGAVALWASLGAMAFLDATSGATRVGVLPSLATLATLLLFASAVIVVVRPTAGDVAPLWLSLILLLPWAPFHMPTSVYIWTGAIRWWVWIAVAVAMTQPALADRWGEQARGLTPNRAAILAGVLAALAFSAGASIATTRYPAGDEPHYLIIAQSLVLDHDLQVENNYTRGDQRAYYPGALKPDYLQRGVNGQIYSVHAPGLPLLIAPVFAVLGYAGVKFALLLVSAAATALAWLVAWRVTKSAAASWFAWAAVALSPPFFLHAFAVYPDAAGAVIVLAGFLPLVDDRWRDPPRLLIVGATLALLPWLHARFALAAAATALVIVGRVIDRPNRSAGLAALFAFPAASAIAWFAFFQIVYGTPDPSAPYGGIPQEHLANLGRGLAGLLFDQQFGILTNAPVYLCGIGGMMVMLWRRERLGIEVLIVCTPYVIAVGAFNMWWAGYAAPARFLVPIALVLVVPTAVWFASARRTTTRVFSVATLLVSLMITASLVAIDGGIAIFNSRTGTSELLQRLSPVVDLTAAWPSFFQGTFAFLLVHSTIWLAVLAAGCLVGFALERRRFAPGVIVLGAGACWAVGAMAATSLIWERNHATPVTPQNGALTVLDLADHDTAQIGLSWPPLRRVHLTDLPPLMTLADVEPRTIEPGFPLLFLTHAPAAVYEIAGISKGPASGRLWVAVDRQSPPLEVWDVAPLGGRWQRTVALPIPVSTLRVDVDPEARASITQLGVRAIAVPSALERPGGSAEAMRGARYGPGKLFLLSGRAYLEREGVWVGGPGTTRFVVTPDPGSPIQLFIRNAPTENEVTLTSGTWRQEIALHPGEERLVRIPGGMSALGVKLMIDNAAGTRPMDFAPPSRDARYLGCWIELR
jgi:hypothetical protein